VVDLPNVGREADTYLTHIVRNWDRLADTTIFCQGDPFPHSPDFLALLRRVDLYEPVQPLTDRYLEWQGMPPPDARERGRPAAGALGGPYRVARYGLCLRSLEPEGFHDPGARQVLEPFLRRYGLPEGTHVGRHLAHKHGFRAPPPDGGEHFCYAAMFAATRGALRAQPLRAYESLRQEVATCGLPVMASVLERVWLWLVGNLPSGTAPREPVGSGSN
jgi:hypothetical protein